MANAPEKYEIRRGQFGWCLEEMKRGRRLCRDDWADGVFVRFVGYSATSAAFEGAHGTYHWQDCIAMKTATDTMVPWTPTQTDLLAEDWEHFDADQD